MKKFFALIAILLLIPSVQALTCSVKTSCSSGETDIFHMSSTTNAHAELSSENNYNHKVCCSHPGTTLGTSCSGVYAVVLRASSQTNAHVEKNTYSNYGYEICLSSPVQSISCIYLDDCSNAPSPGYECLASISSDTNAHVGDCNAYPTKVCCKVSVCSYCTYTEGGDPNFCMHCNDAGTWDNINEGLICDEYSNEATPPGSEHCLLNKVCDLACSSGSCSNKVNCVCEVGRCGAECASDADCNDSDSCTIDTCESDCNCSHTQITNCIDDDNCCPPGCNANNDNDCSPVCGNGVVETGEECEPPNTDLQTCDQGGETYFADRCDANCQIIDKDNICRAPGSLSQACSGTNTEPCTSYDSTECSAHSDCCQWDSGTGTCLPKPCNQISLGNCTACGCSLEATDGCTADIECDGTTANSICNSECKYPNCTLEANPSGGVGPFYSELTATYYNLPSGTGFGSSISGVPCEISGTATCTDGGGICTVNQDCTASGTGCSVSCPSLPNTVLSSNTCSPDYSNCEYCVIPGGFGFGNCVDTAHCSATGSCNYDCLPGYYDCDGIISNGCESNTPCLNFGNQVNMTCNTSDPGTLVTLDSNFQAKITCLYPQVSSPAVFTASSNLSYIKCTTQIFDYDSVTVNFDAWLGFSSASLTAGQEFPLKVYVKNNGTIKDSYTIVAIPSTNVQIKVYDNIIESVSPGKISSAELGIIPAISSGETVYIMVNSTLAPNLGIILPLTISSGTPSLSGLDNFSILIIILMAIFLFMSKIRKENLNLS